MRRALGLLFLAACSSRTAGFPPVVGKVEEGGELVGKRPPPLAVEWTDGGTHPLAEDRGRVVLVRWWTDTCPLCANSAGAIAALKREYGDRLAVRAIFHDKTSGRELTRAQVEALAKQVGFPGLVGIDRSWVALRRWWLDHGGRRFTSVSFLLDKRGRIRLVHTGGEFHARGHVPDEACLFDPAQCAAEYAAVERAIAVLAAE